MNLFTCWCGLSDGFTGIYTSQLSPQCWSADSQRVLIACPQRSRKVRLMPRLCIDNITSWGFVKNGHLGDQKHFLLTDYIFPTLSCPGIIDGGYKHRERHLSDIRWVTWSLIPFVFKKSPVAHLFTVLLLCEWCSVVFVESDIGNWCLLTIERDLMVVSCSSPSRPPSLVGSQRQITKLPLFTC